MPRLERDGHAVRGFARSPERVAAAGVELPELVVGDAVTGAGLDRGARRVDVAYYLIHSMEGAAAGAFAAEELRAAEAFAAAAGAAGVRRVVYLGGLVAPGAPLSRHLASRLAVEQTPARGRAGGDRAARLDRDRRPLALVPLPRPADRAHAGARPARLARQPHGADRRARRARRSSPARRMRPAALAGSWDIGGPDVMTYAEMIARIADALLRPAPLARTRRDASRR